MRFDNYITNIDTNAKGNATVLPVTNRKFADARLELHRSPDGFDGALKLCQESVAGVLHDATTVFSNFRLDNLYEKRSQLKVRSLFVTMH